MVGARNGDGIAELVDFDDVGNDLTLCRFPNDADRKDQRNGEGRKCGPSPVARPRDVVAVTLIPFATRGELGVLRHGRSRRS
jgi:hypothetical protein